jgi:hypothetical protein
VNRTATSRSGIITAQIAAASWGANMPNGMPAPNTSSIPPSVLLKPADLVGDGLGEQVAALGAGHVQPHHQLQAIAAMKAAA